jgi:hypothetical protein
VRAYVIASILIIISLLAIAFKGSLSEGNLLLPYLNDFSSALLVSGMLSLLFKVFQDKETTNDLRRLMRIHDSVDELGLQEIIPESQGYSFTPLIEESDELFIVMNDGQRWIGNNTVALQNRFSKNGVTEIFTVDPDSTFVESLAQKTSYSQEELKNKIRDAWRRLEESYNNSDKKGILKIYSLKTYPTRTIFLSEKILIETPYQIASGRANIPTYIYQKTERKDSPYFFALHDIGAIRKEAKLIFEFGKDCTNSFSSLSERKVV